MKKDIQSLEEVEMAQQSLLDHFLKEEMSKAQFLEIVGSKKSKGKLATLNSGCMWTIMFAGGREIGDDQHFDFIVRLQCPSCENPMTHQAKTDRFPNGAWFCQSCDTGVSCFKGTVVPLGFPASTSLRKLRSETREFVNEMVKSAGGSHSHPYVYHWMTKRLGYNPDETFITLASVSAAELRLLQQHMKEWLRSDNPSKAGELFELD